MDDLKKFIETALPEKEDFYSHLNKQDITDSGLPWIMKLNYVSRQR